MDCGTHRPGQKNQCCLGAGTGVQRRNLLWHHGRRHGGGCAQHCPAAAPLGDWAGLGSRPGRTRARQQRRQSRRSTTRALHPGCGLAELCLAWLTIQSACLCALRRDRKQSIAAASASVDHRLAGFAGGRRDCAMAEPQVHLACLTTGLLRAKHGRAERQARTQGTRPVEALVRPCRPGGARPARSGGAAAPKQHATARAGGPT